MSRKLLDRLLDGEVGWPIYPRPPDIAWTTGEGKIIRFCTQAQFDALELNFTPEVVTLETFAALLEIYQ